MNEEATTGSGGGGGKGISIAALICGLGAFVPGLCCGIIGIPAAILAIIFGIVGRNRGHGGMATAGIALGIIYLIVFVILMIAGVSLQEYQPDFMKDMQGTSSSTDTGTDGDGDGGGGEFGQDPNDGNDGND